jgi:uncharacterized protein YbaR (Trm112 family)
MNSNQNRPALEQWASDLACPACHGELRPGGEKFVCARCGRSYPVVEGIPVLIVERAEMPRVE